MGCGESGRKACVAEKEVVSGGSEIQYSTHHMHTYRGDRGRRGGHVYREGCCKEGGGLKGTRDNLGMSREVKTLKLYLPNRTVQYSEGERWTGDGESWR